MDLLSRIASWLGENEATISAVVGIVFAGLRSLVRRRGETSQEKAPAVSPEATSADSSPADLDPLTVPGFEGRPAIAVLAFDNLSGDPEQEYFADGIAEDLITRISAPRWFPVIARNSSFKYKRKAVDVKQVRRVLVYLTMRELRSGRSIARESCSRRAWMAPFPSPAASTTWRSRRDRGPCRPRLRTSPRPTSGPTCRAWS